MIDLMILMSLVMERVAILDWMISMPLLIMEWRWKMEREVFFRSFLLFFDET